VNGELNVDLFDATGRLVRSEQVNIVNGAQQVELNLSGLETGVYTVQFELNGASATRQLSVR
jgi:hypothetical protein